VQRGEELQCCISQIGQWYQIIGEHLESVQRVESGKETVVENIGIVHRAVQEGKIQWTGTTGSDHSFQLISSCRNGKVTAVEHDLSITRCPFQMGIVLEMGIDIGDQLSQQFQCVFIESHIHTENGLGRIAVVLLRHEGTWSS